METLPEEAQLIWADSKEQSVSSSKTLAYGKMSKKTENLSKMVCGAHFETFYACYLIFLGKDTFL